MKKFISAVFTGLMTTTILFGAMSQNVFAAQNTGYGTAQGRTDTVNVNDYSTNDWDRFSANYQFGSGPNYGNTLGQPTGTDAVPHDSSTDNVRRNKDAAFIPPSYGTFSGQFDTDRSNPYITPDSNDYALVYVSTTSNPKYDTQSNGVNGATGNGGAMLPSTSLTLGNGDVSTANASMPNTSGITSQTAPNGNVTTSTKASNVTVATTPTNTNTLNTEALLYPDGSMGILEIPKLGVKVKVWDGESLDNLKIGVGHFSFTSAWDGNVGIAGHNGGSAGYFENIKNLVPGDKITYTTPYGTRTYQVSSLTPISVTDFSTLGFSTDNRLTLITCVRNVPDQRLSLVATLVK